jgi:putative serine protease PepD
VTTGQEPYPQQHGSTHQPTPQTGPPAPPLGPFPPAPGRAVVPVHPGRLAAPTAAQPGYPGQPPAQSAPASQALMSPQAPASTGHPGQPATHQHQPAPGQFGGGFPLQQPARRRLAWPGVTALLLVALLLGAVVFQALQIRSLNDRLEFARAESRAGQDQDGARFSSTEERIGALESQLGSAFNAEKIAAATLPSVFRVRAGEFTGTAFAVGAPAAGGGTNLFTNAHVVEAEWDSGNREVFLERDGKRHPATIVAVDKGRDVAHLRASASFNGLKVATEPVKPGQQVVVVGAPLGLDDTVTSGVVSAIRDDPTEPAIQFDAAINPGNSGGPVINASQQVVGIATAKARNAEGIGLAIPIAVACSTYRIC